MQNNISTPVFKISNHLIRAYKGFYDDHRILEQDDKTFKAREDFSEEEFNTWILWRIVADSAYQRLDTYLTWEGIHGYSSTVYDIATGKLC